MIVIFLYLRCRVVFKFYILYALILGKRTFLSIYLLINMTKGSKLRLVKRCKDFYQCVFVFLRWSLSWIQAECTHIYTVETELKVTQSALDVHMGCTTLVKD